jgi:hypothetical protein
LAAAAFDTLMPGPATLTGRASKAIARQLRRHELLSGEQARARAWAERVAAAANAA